MSGRRSFPSWLVLPFELLKAVAPLLTRIAIGLAFVQTGTGKWAHLDRTTEFFTDLGIPMPAANAVVVATLELVGGGALIAGLLTRFFAAGLSTTMVVALLTADRETFVHSWSRASEAGPTDVTSFVFLLFLLWLVAFGPGPLSLDRLLARVYRRVGAVLGARADTSRGPAAKKGESSEDAQGGSAEMDPSRR